MKPVKNEKQRRKSGWIFPALSAALFITGAAVFAYPAVSNYLAERNQAAVIQDYEQALTDEESPVDLEAEWEKAEVYNENLTGDSVRDPFVPGSGYALPENYREVLNVDGVMGYVEIPKISVRLPIYHGASEEVLQKGVGHIESTALPIGGEGRHTVLTGHRGLPSAELFSRLDELEMGDIFLIHVLDKTLAYKVDQIKTVLPTELEDLRAERGRDLATLLTCTPYGINTHRLLVRGERTDYVPEEAQAQKTADLLSRIFDSRLQYVGAALGLLLLLVILLLIRHRRKKRDDPKKRGGRKRHGRR